MVRPNIFMFQWLQYLFIINSFKLAHLFTFHSSRGLLGRVFKKCKIRLSIPDWYKVKGDPIPFHWWLGSVKV